PQNLRVESDTDIRLYSLLFILSPLSGNNPGFYRVIIFNYTTILSLCQESVFGIFFFPGIFPALLLRPRFFTVDKRPA
ncbi:MAG: hypothetical protein J6V48_07625, partial [Clostridia bacterium]|nr:hypothetical protein [Clostridia bacterium]